MSVVFVGCLAAIHYKGLSLKLSRSLRRMGFTAKGAFACTFLFKNSLRGCLRVFFLQTRVRVLCWNLNFIPCQKMKKRKKTIIIVKVWRANHNLIEILITGALWMFSAFARPSRGLREAFAGLGGEGSEFGKYSH